MGGSESKVSQNDLDKILQKIKDSSTMNAIKDEIDKKTKSQNITTLYWNLIYMKMKKLRMN
jgi:hypothetical protein